MASIGVPEQYSTIPKFRRLAALDRKRRHELVPNPGEADAIVFTECHLSGSNWSFSRIRATDEFRMFRDRCYVMDERDQPWLGLPGLYTSMPKPVFRPEFQSAWGYYFATEPQGSLPDSFDTSTEPDLLFSFVGSLTHRCREPLLELEYPRAVDEEILGFMFYDPNSFAYEERRTRFAEILVRSKFVLCPRGHGTSSIRLYETMGAGRVPVIISDDWVPPFGLPYDEFCLFWPEGKAEGLVEELERLEPRAAEMGARARTVFEEHFAQDAVFDLFGESLAGLHAKRPWATFRRFGYPDRYFLKRRTHALASEAAARGRSAWTRFRPSQ